MAVDLNQWLAIPGNIEKYKAWRDEPITTLMLDGVRAECKPRPVPPWAMTGEMALNLNGITVGEHRVLDRLADLLDTIPIERQIAEDYDLVSALASQEGCTRQEAKAMLARAQDRGEI